MTEQKYIRPERPKILGIAHFSAYTDDLKSTASLFTGFFGFGEPFYTRKVDGRFVEVAADENPEMMLVKVNDSQYVEFVKDDLKREWKYRHTAFEVEDLEAMRVYLRMMGVKVPDSVLDPGLGFKCFFIQDFSGHDVEFVQYTGDGVVGRHLGEAVPQTQVSGIMRHVGWLCDDFCRDLAFYSFILGFKEFWRGGPDDQTSKWIKLAMPDSERNDYIEIMLYDQKLDQAEMGCQNHISLDVADVPATVELLNSRPRPAGVLEAEPMKVGACGYGQSNIYTVDKTRIEVMTMVPVGGVPTKTIYGIPARYEE